MKFNILIVEPLISCDIYNKVLGVFQFSEAEDGEIREKYIFYCEGYGIDFPE